MTKRGSVKNGSLVDRIFRSLHGRCFTPWREFENALLKEFNERLQEIPPGYTYLQLIEFAKKNRWIRQDAEGKFWVIYRGTYAPKRFVVNAKFELIGYTKEEVLRRMKQLCKNVSEDHAVEVSVSGIERETTLDLPP